MLNEYRVQSRQSGASEQVPCASKTWNLKPETWNLFTSYVLRFTVLLLFTIHFSLLTGSAHAARPLVTEDVVVAGKGVTQLEIGIDYTRDDDEEGTTLLFSPIHGVTEDTEFSLKVPYIFANPDDSQETDGWGDVSFIMKHLFIDEGEKTPAVLVRMLIKLPTGDEGDGLGTGDTNVGFLGALTKGYGSATLHLNLGYTFVGDQDEGKDDNEVNYGVAGEYRVGKKAGIVGEMYGLYHPDYKAKEIERRALLGLTYRLDDTFTFDLAGKRGLDAASDEYGIVGGVTITF